jgi:NodT family efflux transporter outer membrane factor (OMF) lipoprotein
MNYRAILLAATMLPTLGACATGVTEPAVPLSIAAPVSNWSAEGEMEQGEVRMDWWKAVGDPQLDQLVEKALAGNADIRAASANLAAADALLREARAARLPSGGISGGIERNRTPGAALQLDVVGGPAVLPTQTLADIGGGLSWELDLAGRIAASGRAAAADRDKAEWARRSAQASVVAGVVRAWFELGSLREQIALVEQRVAALRSGAEALGKATAVGGVRADQRDAVLADLRALEGALPALKAGERNAARRIATLTGAPAPEGVRNLSAMQPASMPLPQYVTAPEPAMLLRLRPDVAMAEQDLLKASAGIKIAKADLYPRINFGSSVGVTASPADLGTTGALRFGIGPSFSWGIFDMGRIRARIHAAGAQADAAAATWESVFLKALEETDASLDQLAASREAWNLSASARALADQELARSAVRFERGHDSRLAHLQVRERALALQLRESEARAAALLAWTNVQIAFGAGWQIAG